MNGKQKAIVIPAFIVGGIISAIFGYGKLNQKVEVNTKDIVEIKEDTKKIPAIEANQAFMMTEQQTIKTDIKAILKAVK